LYVRLGSGSSFEIIDSAESQLTNPVIGEFSDLKFIQIKRTEVKANIVF